MTTIPPSPAERAAMQFALDAARDAAHKGEIPVGAVVLDPAGEVLATGSNAREALPDPTAHAEVVAIRETARIVGDRMLEGCTLVVTLEPCAMCAGVILAARLSRVIFGAWDAKAGAVGSVYDLLRDGRLPHTVPEVVAGVCAEECAALLEEFFRDRRRTD